MSETMKMKTMTASAASKEFGHYIDTVQREPVVITRQNRPVAVTLSMQDARDLFQFRVEAGIAEGLNDVQDGRIDRLTTAFSEELKARFRAS
jgi:prevent-host-death family protein